MPSSGLTLARARFMRRHRFGLTALALVCFLSGCDFVGASPPPWLNSLPPPQRPYYSYSSRRHIRSSERAGSARTRYAKRESSATSNTDLPPPAVDNAGNDRATAPSAAVSNPAVTLSMAGDSGDRQQAQRLLEAADASLIRARGRHLTAAEEETYQRAIQLASRARRALADNDCAAASSLAGKASSLAAGIGGR